MGEKDTRNESLDNDLLPSCVEDDVVEGVIRCVFVDVDDGRGWARCGWSTDCIDSRGRVAGGTMYVNLVCPPAVEHVKKSAEPPVT